MEGREGVSQCVCVFNCVHKVFMCMGTNRVRVCACVCMYVWLVLVCVYVLKQLVNEKRETLPGVTVCVCVSVIPTMTQQKTNTHSHCGPTEVLDTVSEYVKKKMSPFRLPLQTVVI